MNRIKILLTIVMLFLNIENLWLTYRIEASEDDWKYQKENGYYACNEWIEINGIWYHFNEYMTSDQGWIKTDGNWYYLGKDGGMVEGWIQTAEGTWYYLKPGSGAMVTGWQIIEKEKSYFFEEEKIPVIEREGYYFGKDGKLLVNGVSHDGYSVDENGQVKYHAGNQVIETEYFKITLPEDWEGKYIWEIYENSAEELGVKFYHKIDYVLEKISGPYYADGEKFGHIGSVAIGNTESIIKLEKMRGNMKIMKTIGDKTCYILYPTDYPSTWECQEYDKMVNDMKNQIQVEMIEK